MDSSRRCFLKTTGVSLVGIGVGAPTVSALATALREPTTATKRLAMVIDTRKCAEVGDCTACAEACHLTHNVPTMDEPRHAIKWIWKERFEHAFPTMFEGSHGAGTQPMGWLKERQTLVLCNHCDDPPCVRICPTQATWKRDDGIVMMDMHRCIGCRFCVVGCPYGSRSFNWKDPRPHIATLRGEFPSRSKGVVEKCNFCADRLSRGKGPACAEACKAGAMHFGDLLDPSSEVATILDKAYVIRRKPALGTAPHVFYIV